MPIVAGVDSGTQSTKVVLLDTHDGRVIGSGQVPHSPTVPPRSEHNPDEWWNALRGALAQARLQAGVHGSDIVGISVAAQCHGLVALDDHGVVIRPVKLWNDTTSAESAYRLRQALGVDEWIKRTGSSPTSAFTVAKLADMVQNEPENYSRVRRIILPHDWLTYRLTGSFVTDRSDASGTGYFSASRMEYDPQILALIDPARNWADCLPPVLLPHEPAGPIRAAIADELDISRRCVVGCGSGDQHASAVGLGIVPGDAVFVLGTSGVVYGLSPTEILDPAGIVNSVAGAAGGYQPLIGTLNCTKVTNRFAYLLDVDLDTFAELALAAPRSDTRLALAAYLDGERFPDRPNSRGTLAGLSSATTREEVALAAYEGVLFGLALARIHLANLGVDMSRRVLVTGGGARSRAFRQILADVIGFPVSTIDTPQPVALGAAMQAAALTAGAQVKDVSAAFARPARVSATPVDEMSAAVWERYKAVANWEGFEE